MKVSEGFQPLMLHWIVPECPEHESHYYAPRYRDHGQREECLYLLVRLAGIPHCIAGDSPMFDRGGEFQHFKQLPFMFDRPLADG
ncbi:MAG: hypothetical protein WKF37_16045 [Bryobacteraceae bacterium]